MTPVLKHLHHSVRKNYKKSFFRKKSLCLLRIAEISGDYDISLGNMYLVQSKQGKVLGQIKAKIQKFNEPDVASQGDITTYYGILELSKKDVKQIQG
jgi:hypothetical protein